MSEVKFVTSECGNTPDEAWNKLVYEANYYKDKNKSILDKSGFKLIGKMLPCICPKEIVSMIADRHIDCNPNNKKALCIDIGDGEYYFIGKSFK